MGEVGRRRYQCSASIELTQNRYPGKGRVALVTIGRLEKCVVQAIERESASPRRLLNNFGRQKYCRINNKAAVTCRPQLVRSVARPNAWRSAALTEVSARWLCLAQGNEKS